MPFLEQASSAAEKVDAVFLFILALSVAFLIFITFLLVFFVIKYSRKRHPKARDIEGNTWLEITWTAVPLVLFLSMFYFGWTNFRYLRSAPRDAMVVKVTGRKWSWEFEYPNGRKTQALYLALDRPVRLEIRSADVIHGFFIPAFRIKMDAVPGKENYTWFTPTQLGAFDIECTVICGVDHWNMLRKTIVVKEDDFKRWYFGGEDAQPPGDGAPAVGKTPDARPAEQSPAVSILGDGAPAVGKTPDARPAEQNPVVYILEKNACLTCHSLDGRVMVGPTFKGAFGSREKVLVGGEEREVIIDEPYLRKAIQEPMAEIVKGFPPAMPPNPLPEADLELVIEYLKSLK